MLPLTISALNGMVSPGTQARCSSRRLADTCLPPLKQHVLDRSFTSMAGNYTTIDSSIVHWLLTSLQALILHGSSFLRIYGFFNQKPTARLGSVLRSYTATTVTSRLHSTSAARERHMTALSAYLTKPCLPTNVDGRVTSRARSNSMRLSPLGKQIKPPSSLVLSSVEECNCLLLDLDDVLLVCRL